jgi:nuclear pore complex protein Nup62
MHVYLCMHACTHVCKYARTHVCMYVCMHVRIYVCMHVCMYVYICMYARMCVCMYVFMYVCMYVCININVYICLYACNSLPHAAPTCVLSVTDITSHPTDCAAIDTAIETDGKWLSAQGATNQLKYRQSSSQSLPVGSYINTYSFFNATQL